MSVTALVALWLGCTSIQIVNHPPPLAPCPTEAQEDMLADLMPIPDDFALALAIERSNEAFIQAASYCRESEKRLR